MQSCSPTLGMQFCAAKFPCPKLVRGSECYWIAPCASTSSSGLLCTSGLRPARAIIKMDLKRFSR